MIRAVLIQACRIAPLALIATGIIVAAPALAETAKKGPSVTAGSTETGVKDPATEAGPMSVEEQSAAKPDEEADKPAEGPSTGLSVLDRMGADLPALPAEKPFTGKIDEAREGELLEALRHLPGSVQHALNLEPQVASWAEKFAPRQHALFLGRGTHYPIALEGALKLKEISYIHAEGYPAGELKHGPLALVDTQMPVVVIAPNDALLEKVKSNIQEVRARGGEMFVFADADSSFSESEGVHVIRTPRHVGILSPIVHAIPVQLLAYHTALARGTDVDKPRNLAKSVTVE